MASNHQPFESWIFMPGDLTAGDQQALQEHLKECESCQQLAQALQGVESRLRAAPELSPTPGFTARWESRLAADRIRRQRLQTYWVMQVCIGGATFLLLLTVLMVLPSLRLPMPVLLAWGYQIFGVFSYFGSLGKAALTITGTLLGAIPITLWIAILVAMCSLSALWLVAFQRLTAPRRVAQ